MNVKIKIQLELEVGDGADFLSVKECVYQYLNELIDDDYLSFSIEPELVEYDDIDCHPDYDAATDSIKDTKDEEEKTKEKKCSGSITTPSLT
jgi:hypothetical protein|tara:strand:- start:152 stop:427 length:276 start_codon:yes stop_codon:yes gene_type:complete